MQGVADSVKEMISALIDDMEYSVSLFVKDNDADGTTAILISDGMVLYDSVYGIHEQE
jgi:hypothetical protein